MNKILTLLKERKGASFMELILIIGALALITVFGMTMFRQQANSTGEDYQDNLSKSETKIKTDLNTNGTFQFVN